MSVLLKQENEPVTHFLLQFHSQRHCTLMILVDSACINRERGSELI